MIFRKSWKRPDIELFTCAEMFDELERVRQYPKLIKILKPSRVAATIELISAKAIVISLSQRTADFIDPKDNYLLDLCDHIQADFLITGDKPLLAPDAYGQTKIITYRAFCDLLAII